MSLFLAWVCFPLLMAAVGLGWGLLVEWAAGQPLPDALMLPSGLAAALVAAGTLTAFSASAPAAVPLVGAGALIGLALFLWPRPRIDRSLGISLNVGKARLPRIGAPATLAAIGVILFYGAPVLLYGEATFTGYLRLDDTATWLNVVNIVMSHARDWAALPISSFRLVFSGDVGNSYPLGSFMLLGIGHGLTGINAAWIFQPYLAGCAALVALCIYDLLEPLLPSRSLRALIGFVAPQAALLYGYALWGGIKEMAAAFTLALGAALLARLARRRIAELQPRELLPLGLAAGALIQTLGIGAGGWAAPALIALLLIWTLRGGGRERPAALVGPTLALALFTALFMIPVWVVLGHFLGNISGLFSEGQSQAQKYGNLVAPLSGWQLVGVWLTGDFRVIAATFPTALFIAFVIGGALWALLETLRRRETAVAIYLWAALAGCAFIYLAGATPWVVGKALAFSSPALPAAGMAGGALLLARRRLRALGVLVLVAITVGVIWSNFLQYRNATLAPRPRLAELAHIAQLVNGKGPTLINEYEVYADRHFLGDGAPVEPAEYRPVTLPLRSGAVLTKAAWTNLDAFAFQTLLPYRSIVTRRSPAESRPPSIWKLVWQGRYYDLWQRPQPAPQTIIEHIPYGEENEHPYCGAASGVKVPLAPCPMSPVAIPKCPQLLSFARHAAALHAHLLAYQRAIPVFAYGNEVLYPASWQAENYSHALAPTAPGTAVGHIAVPTGQRYALYLAGNFGARGIEVRIDHRKVGFVANQLSGFLGFVPVADIYLSAGVHSFEYTFPEASLAPGSGEFLSMGEDSALDRFTSLEATLLQPLEFPRSEMISLLPSEAAKLCNRPLEWLEIVRGA